MTQPWNHHQQMKTLHLAFPHYFRQLSIPFWKKPNTSHTHLMYCKGWSKYHHHHTRHDQKQVQTINYIQIIHCNDQTQEGSSVVSAMHVASISPSLRVLNKAPQGGHVDLQSGCCIEFIWKEVLHLLYTFKFLRSTTKLSSLIPSFCPAIKQWRDLLY